MQASSQASIATQCSPTRHKNIATGVNVIATSDIFEAWTTDCSKKFQDERPDEDVLVLVHVVELNDFVHTFVSHMSDLEGAGTDIEVQYKAWLERFWMEHAPAR